jgi:hypothetical protein
MYFRNASRRKILMSSATADSSGRSLSTDQPVTT